MKLHTDVLNELVDEYGLTNYLEIGVQNPRNNFDLIKCPYKIGIDPNPFHRAGFVGTSDDFFSLFLRSDIKVPYPFCYDLSFIDGYHHLPQVKRDFDNSLLHLNPGGFIVIHDTLPESEHLTHVPRDKKGRWLGDVFKFIILLNSYDGIDFYTHPFDNGITVVWKDETKKGDTTINESHLTWEYYQQNKEKIMRLKPR
jgi:hypothetical protein